MKEYFKQVNVNPKNKKSTDCVIRALVTATNYSIEEIIKSLTAIYLKTGWFITDKKCIDKFLTLEGLTKMKQVKKENGTKYTGKEFCEYLNKTITTKEPVIASMAGHLTVFKDFEDGNGYVIVDSWDCGSKCVGNWWVKSEEE